MSENNKLASIKSNFLSPWLIASHLSVLLWYLALFPGRLGYDPVKAIELIRNGESTDWWSSEYFWFLKITTFGGQSIWITSLISAVTLYLAFLYFMRSIPIKQSQIEKTSFLVCVSPLFGNFAVNINHDTFVTSGIFLLIGISLRKFYLPNKHSKPHVYFIVTVLLLNSKTGFFLIFTFFVYLLLIKEKPFTIIKIALLSLLVFFVTGIGVTKSDVPMQILPVLADIKCVTQHPEARITASEWKYLSSISSLNLWKTPLSCASMDDAVRVISNPKIYAINHVELLRNYVTILSRNPAIVIEAHLQRSSQALPPPFFQGPQNQVNRDVSKPVGYKTNIALQSGAELLHISIDDPTLKIQNSPFSLFEKVFLFFSFLINQASWFWGWGGLWLWPILIFQIGLMRIRNWRILLALNYPIIANHLFHVLVGPVPSPRYVMSTILIGYTLTILMAINWWQSEPKEMGIEKI